MRLVNLGPVVDTDLLQDRGEGLAEPAALFL